MNINMRQLRSLVAIARLGNFTRAARALHISQPALTVQMHQLERALGMRLLDRNTRSVRLTHTGQQLLPVVERALSDIDRAIEGTRLTPESCGIVSLAALPSLCANIIPPAIASFNAHYPGVLVRLHETSAARIANAVLDEFVEFGIGIVERSLAGMRSTPFMTDRLVVVCPAEHPLTRKKKVVIADLAAYPIIALDSLSTTRTMLEAALHALGDDRAAAQEVSFISTAVGMVRAGLGITVMSSSALGRAVMTGLAARMIEHPEFNREIVIVRKQHRTLSPAAERLLECVCAARDAVRNDAALRASRPRRQAVGKSVGQGTRRAAAAA